jgi:bifunctional DNA-binding transcriptional regulator/antitoxin component of YhaV-PrlF toxin-antitoxin module
LTDSLISNKISDVKRKRRKPEAPKEFGVQESSVYDRGQTVVPKTIREVAAIEYGTRLRWEVSEGVIHVIPVQQHPVRALRGILKGSGMTFGMFMQERQKQRELERKREQAWQAEEPQRRTRRRRGPGTS